MLKIGTGDWVRQLKEMTVPLGPQFWAKFKPATRSELKSVERQIDRKLDPEFCEFYRKVGYGEFQDEHGYCGSFYSPEVLVYDVSCPIYFVTGSMTPGSEWAPAEEQKRLWLSRGNYNPNPKEFTDEVLTLNGAKLYDLLQFGDNGLCGYHQLYVGPEPAPFRCCTLYGSEEMENRAASFSEGLEKILAVYFPEESPPIDLEVEFSKNDAGLWSLTGGVDFPFQKGVLLTFELTQERRHLPESMEKNVPWLMDRMGEIWNAAAAIVNQKIEEDRINKPEKFALNGLMARIPDKPLESAEWTLTIDPAGMPECFEVRFKGLDVVSLKCL